MLRRLLQLYIGLVLYGVSTALFVHANLGADPWDVFHLGVAKQLGISFRYGDYPDRRGGTAAVDPDPANAGLGTVSNVIVLGLAADATLAVLPPLESMVARSALLVGAIVLNAIATGMYIGAGFGPAARWPDDRSACSHWLVTARYPDGDRAFRTADWLAAGGQIWRRNRHLRAVDWAADPAVPTVVQPARQPQRGQPSPGNSLLN
ncbi:membrane protein [Klebsiella pneumoniae]|uniref:Membrane protein n=1 Tax=Klebsiella pneumoniae TaxID=573 RepID=A0A377TLU8_KLEPN|nr:membrane protein [Klebsiella pneumoniae]